MPGLIRLKSEMPLSYPSRPISPGYTSGPAQGHAGAGYFDPYRHPETLLEVIAREDAKVLLAMGPYLSESLNDPTHSFEAQLATATVERLE